MENGRCPYLFYALSVPPSLLLLFKRRNSMILAEKIIQHLEKMPESAQTQVFDFVKYLESKTKEGEQTQDETEWLTFSALLQI